MVGDALKPFGGTLRWGNEPQGAYCGLRASAPAHDQQLQRLRRSPPIPQCKGDLTVALPADRSYRLSLNSSGGHVQPDPELRNAAA